MLRHGLRKLKHVRFVVRAEDGEDDWKRGTMTTWPAFAMDICWLKVLQKRSCAQAKVSDS